MKFQPGQSGNPAGRPPGSRNRKSVITEEMLTLTAQETAKWIIARAQTGDRTAMRLVMERADPTGIDRPLQLELPPVSGPEDLIAAAGVVLQALAGGGLSARETVCMLTVVERLGRIAERAQQMKERREGRRDGPSAGAAASNGAGLHSPVNSAGASSGAASQDAPVAGTANSEALCSPVNAGGETARPDGKEPSPEAAAAADVLYFPVNSRETPAPGAADAALPASASGLDAAENSRELQADAAIEHPCEAGDGAPLVPREINGGPGDVPARGPQADMG
jgi:hypothetical protein